MKINLESRYKKLLSILPENSSVIIGSAPEKIRSRDIHYPYRQDSNFYYLTQSNIKDVVLCINSKKQRILLTPPASKLKAVWEGEGESPKKLAKELKADLVETENFEKQIRKFIAGNDHVYFQNTSDSKVNKIIREIQCGIIHPYPPIFVDADNIIGKLRLFKEPGEVNLIQEAIYVTEEALANVQQIIEPKMSEYELSVLIETIFKFNKADLAFNSIVAAGSSAAVLHYHDVSKEVKKNQFVLIDIGAEKDLYCSDLTRTFPVGKPSSAEIDVYNIVLEAQLKAIDKVKHGVKIKEVYLAAVNVLVRGLIDLKVLKGSVTENIAKRTYFEYFPHGIGHSLGIDTHDVGNLRGNNQAVLEKDMVFTIEPGLYFPKPVKNIPAMGVRIEDDVLVTKTGCKVLSSFPKTLNF